MRLTIRRKMFLFIGLPTALISLAAMVWGLAYAERQARRIEASLMAEIALTAASRLDDYISTGSRIADTTARFVSRINTVTEDQIYGILSDNLSVSNRIFGAVMAFEPGTYKEGDVLFAPYACRGPEGINLMDVTREVYDWYGDKKWTWWHLPKEREEGIWTDPFFDEGAGDIWMTTYAVPFFDGPNGGRKFRGVTTVDIDIEVLKDELSQSMPELQGFCVINPMGKFIIPPEWVSFEEAEKKTVYEILEEHGAGDLTNEVQSMISGKSGEVTLSGLFQKESSFYAYTPISSPGWTMIAFKSEKAALADFHANRKMVVGGFIAAIALIVGVTVIASGRLADPILNLERKVLRIAEGDPAVSLDDIRTHDEIEELAKAFGVMQERVSDREQRLHSARETTLTELLESAPDPMIVVDSHGRIHRFNSKATEIFGYDQNELSGMEISLLLSGGYRDSHGPKMAEYFRTPSPRQVGPSPDLQGLRKDGSEFPIEVGLNVFHDGGERMVVAAIRDITKRTADQEALKVKEERFRTLVSNIPGTVFRCHNDSKWTMIFLSDDVEELTGYPANDFIDNRVRSFNSIIVPEDREDVVKKVRQAISDHSAWEIEYRIERRDGGIRWIDETGRAMFDRNGNVECLDGVLVDISARKEMQEQLQLAREQAEAANRAKSEFLSHMSHELRTPLNGVLGYAQILYRSPDVTEKQRKSLDAIVNCGDHLLSLINDVLDLSKIDAGKIEIEEAPCNLHGLIEGVGNIVSSKARAKGLDFKTVVSPEVPPAIKTDAAKVRQILVNLLGNAVKFTSSGEVSLTVNLTRNRNLKIAVSDSGIGIKPDELEVIFDPFKQVEAGKAAGGTGLGLAITKRLSTMLGGSLKVSSSYGKGSTFTLTIPLVEALEEELEQIEGESLESANLVLAPGQAATILVADDRDTNRDILDQMLVEMGFKVELADDGDTALEKLRDKADIDLVLMDVQMPRMNGVEAVRQMREELKLSDTPVIAVTASVFPQFKEKAIEAGFDDFLGKPFRTAELVARLQDHLDVEFVEANPDTKPQERVTPSSVRLPQEALEELRSALKIRNLTAINNLAKKLMGSDETSAAGELLGELARSFDFKGLAEMVED